MTTKKTALLWVVQQVKGDQRDFCALHEACQSLGLEVLPVPSQSFFDGLPDAPQGRLAIYHGSALFLKNVYEEVEQRAGVFFTPESFLFSSWSKRLGNLCLNADYRRSTVDAFVQEGHAGDHLFFLRPDSSLKEFSGGLYSFETFCALSRVRLNWFQIEPSLIMIVAPPAAILREWRVFMVNGLVSAGCQYRQGGKVAPAPGLPEHVRDFATQVASLYSPAKVFVIDVGELNEGLKVIELNPFNCSGFYLTDMTRLVADVSDALQGAY